MPCGAPFAVFVMVDGAATATPSFLPHGRVLVEYVELFLLKLIGARQIEHPFGDEIEDHFAADRSDAGYIAFA